MNAKLVSTCLKIHDLVAAEVTRRNIPAIFQIRIRLLTSAATIVLLTLTGCAHYPANIPKTANRTDGYYYHNHPRTNNSEDILFVLAFSGGGTRASAFSYGLLEALRDTTFEVEGKKRRLLDEVDAISSVSGGSVTAAAYGLYGDRIFDIFEPAFLKRNVELALLGQVLNPLHWPALWSSTYSRSDLAAKYYDKILFKNARFQDLATNNTPYLVMNSTDVDTGTRLAFDQNCFDLLASDLDPYPLSRAVAASSAVPGVLTLVQFDGKQFILKVGTKVADFAQVQVGNQVRATVVEKIVERLDKDASGGATAVESVGLVAENTQVTSKIIAVDSIKRTLTLRIEDGTTQTFPIREDVALSGIKLGDQIVFRVLDITAIQIEKLQ